jgi:hypothetical protein
MKYGVARVMRATGESTFLTDYSNTTKADAENHARLFNLVVGGCRFYYTVRPMPEPPPED